MDMGTSRDDKSESLLVRARRSQTNNWPAVLFAVAVGGGWGLEQIK